MRCDIIRDLLPSYIDGLTSEGSNQAIEQHLDECAECRQYYGEMKGELEEVVEKANPDAEMLLKGAKKHIIIRQLLLILLPFIMVPVIYLLLTKINFYKDLEEGDILGLYELENGDIYCVLRNNEKYNHCMYYDPNGERNLQVPPDKGKTEEGNIYLYTTMDNWLQTAGEADDGGEGFTFIFRRSKTLEGVEGAVPEYTISYGREGKSGYQSIWKEGQPLEKASDEMEKDAASRENEDYISDEEYNMLLNK